MRDFARGQRCGSLISTIASVQECPDLTRASNTTFLSFPAVTLLSVDCQPREQPVNGRF